MKTYTIIMKTLLIPIALLIAGCCAPREGFAYEKGYHEGYAEGLGDGTIERARANP